MITQQEYSARRQALAQKLPKDAVAVFPAAEEVSRNGDAQYRFRQDSNFYYLTGFNEPNAVLVISSGENPQTVLFNRPRNPLEEQWSGARLGQEAACKVLGVDSAFAIETLATQLPELLANKDAIYYPIGHHPHFEKTLFKAWSLVKAKTRRGIKAPQSLWDVEPLISEMRLFKSKGEIALMQKAATASVEAHLRAIKACRKARFEYELEAELLYVFAKEGCRAVAYDPIVGSGSNTCILHYTENDKPLKSGDLLLIDAGGEFANYAADITRTFPVNGRFTKEQRAIYELVLTAQREAIACIKPGVPWDAMQQTIVAVLTAGLCELGLLKGSVDALIASQAYKPFYMHNSGHWLGLDVHDAGLYKINGEWRVLEPGMVLTVEPGLYLHEGLDIESRWKNIGVRIEDDVLVTDNGYEVLTAGLPVEVAEIEALLSE
ncbi:MAG: Xaa-Pro aminopeptidase [Tatlockia sp.]|jgi:Xaa-Pro aminopeptidase